MAKKITPKKQAKKSSPKKKVAKKAAPKKKVFKAKSSGRWKVVCSVDKVLKRGLGEQEAKELAEQHEAETGHPTTWVGSQ